VVGSWVAAKMQIGGMGKEKEKEGGKDGKVKEA
jgi:hypothetical protein